MRLTLENLDTIDFQAALLHQCYPVWSKHPKEVLRQALVNVITDTSFMEANKIDDVHHLEYDGRTIVKVVSTPDRGVIPVLLEEMHPHERNALNMVIASDDSPYVLEPNGRIERVIRYDPAVSFEDHLRNKRRVLGKFARVEEDDSIDTDINAFGINNAPQTMDHVMLQISNSRYWNRECSEGRVSDPFPSLYHGIGQRNLIGQHATSLNNMGLMADCSNIFLELWCLNRMVAFAQFVRTETELLWTNTIAMRTSLEWKSLSLGSYIIGWGLREATESKLDFNMGMDLPYKLLWGAEEKVLPGLAFRTL